MACRMLVAAGRLPLGRLLDDFQLMALNRNEEHEYRHHPDHTQGDGWGVVTGKAGRFECNKNVMPCWHDPRFIDLYQADLDFVMLHARKASPGMAVKYGFTHPFQENGWYFCHNGTIHDFVVEDRSDAQQLFALVLENVRQYVNITEAIRRTVTSLKDYSALNFMLCKDDRVYVLSMYGRRGDQTPNYFTIKYLQAEDYVIVSSERLLNCGGEWRAMQNGTLLTLTLPDRRIEICGI